MSYRTPFAVGTLLLAGALFGVIAANLAQGNPLTEADARIGAWLTAHSGPALTLLMVSVTHAHGPVAVCAYATGMAVVLAARREWSWLVGLVLAVPGGLLINVLLKHIFARARPTLESPVLTIVSYSFPSGHTAGTTLFYGVLASYVMYRVRRRAVSIACAATALALVAIVATSRVYLGVHFASDVLGAVAWSLAWLAVCLLVAQAVHARAASSASR